MVNSAHSHPLRFQLLTIGFCTDLAGEGRLLAAGVERCCIFRRGDGNACDIDDALDFFRERGGCLALTDDFRIFGGSRAAILAKVSAITRETRTKGPIKIVNIDQPDKDTYQLIDQAVGKLHAAANARRSTACQASPIAPA